MDLVGREVVREANGLFEMRGGGKRDMTSRRIELDGCLGWGLSFRDVLTWHFVSPLLAIYRDISTCKRIIRDRS